MRDEGRGMREDGDRTVRSVIFKYFLRLFLELYLKQGCYNMIDVLRYFSKLK